MSTRHGGAYAVALDLQRCLRFSRGAVAGMRAAVVIGLLIHPLIFGLLLLLSPTAFVLRVIQWGALIDAMIFLTAAIACIIRYRKEARVETGPYVVQVPPAIRQTVREQVRVITSKLRFPLPDLQLWLDRRNFHLSPTTVLTKEEGPGIVLPLGFVPVLRARPDEGAAILAHSIAHVRQGDSGLWAFVHCYWRTYMRVALPLVFVLFAFSLGVVVLMTSGESVATESGAMESGQEQPPSAGPASVTAPTSQPGAVGNSPASAPSPTTQPSSAQRSAAPAEAIKAAASISPTPAPISEPARFATAAPVPTSEPGSADVDSGAAGAAATSPSNDDEEDTSATEEPIVIPFWGGIVLTVIFCALAPGMLVIYYVGLCTQRRNSEAIADLTTAASGNAPALVQLLNPEADSGSFLVNRWPWLKMQPTNTWRHRRALRALSLIDVSFSDTADDAFSLVDTPGWRALERATSFAMRLGIGHTFFALFGLVLMIGLFRWTKGRGETLPFIDVAALVLAAIVPLAYVYFASAARRFKLAAVRVLAFISAGYLAAFILALVVAFRLLSTQAPEFIPSVFFAAMIVVPFVAVVVWEAFRAIPAVRHVAERLREPTGLQASGLIASNAAK